MGPLTLTTPSATQIKVVRHFDAPAAMVWRAFTEPDLIKRWLTGPPGHTMPECKVDLRVGGAWRYVWAMPEGRMAAYGIYREIVEAKRIVHTETFDVAPDNETLVETDFDPQDGSTLVTMLIHYDSEETRDALLSSDMAAGMEASYTSLDGLLEHAS